MKPGDELLTKIALSTTSVEGAKKNMDTELPGWDFEVSTKGKGARKGRLFDGNPTAPRGASAENTLVLTSKLDALSAFSRTQHTP